MTKKPKSTLEEKKEYKRLLLEGWASNLIGIKCNRDPTTIDWWRRKWGIPPYKRKKRTIKLPPTIPKSEFSPKLHIKKPTPETKPTPKLNKYDKITMQPTNSGKSYKDYLLIENEKHGL